MDYTFHDSKSVFDGEMILLLNLFNRSFGSKNLPRSFRRSFLDSEPLGGHHRAGSQFGIGGRGDYTLLQLLIYRRRARHHALDRVGKRGGGQRHRDDDAVRRSCRRLSNDRRGLGLCHCHYHRCRGCFCSNRCIRRRRLNGALYFYLQLNIVINKTLYIVISLNFL